MPIELVLIIIVGMVCLIWYNSGEIINPIKKCSGPHKWTKDINNELFCKVCKIRPGITDE